ncbi:MAG: DNA cytosine methyltransferase [Candidatus Angelobacter sp.]
MGKPKLLDLFCGAGGTAVGYNRAGFDVVGVDLAPQKHYPFAFHQADALEVLDTLLTTQQWQGYHLSDFAVIHASPPCQAYSRSRHFRSVTNTNYTRPMLIAPILRRLRASGVPWILENVSGALDALHNALELCGTAFGLPILRHRIFLCSEMLFAPSHCKHPDAFYNVTGGKVRAIGAHRTNKAYVTKSGQTQYREGHARKSVGQAAMGIDWMTLKEMSEAIPPAYTEYLGRQLLSIVEREAA